MSCRLDDPRDRRSEPCQEQAMDLADAGRIGDAQYIFRQSFIGRSDIRFLRLRLGLYDRWRE